LFLGRTTTTSVTQQTITTTAITELYLNFSSRSFFHFHWKFNDSFDSSSDESSSPRLTLLTFVLYVIFTLLALTLLIILLAIIIFNYRKHCLPSTTPIIDYRYHSNRKKKPNHTDTHDSYIDQDARTERTMITTIRPYH
jgi:hypothetical protein